MKNGNRNHGRMVKKRPPPPPLFIGPWIRALGKTPAEVAKDAPMNEGYLSQLISGKKKTPSIEILQAIAKVLDIPRDKLHEPPPSKEVIDAARSLGPSVLDRLRSTTNH